MCDRVGIVHNAIKIQAFAAYLVIFLDENERGHGCDVVFLRYVIGLVHVDLEEDDVVHRLLHLFDLRGDHLARTAPRGVKVNDNELAA